MIQGVGYRSYARNYARELGLKGFVKNLRSGKVELVVEGYDKEIQTLLQILRKGSWGAKVEDIDVDWQEPTNEFKDFEVKT